MQELVYSVKVGTRDALLDGILDAAYRIRNSQRKLQRATRAVHNRAAACVAAGGVVFENQLKPRSMEIKGNFTKLTLHL
jgi:hypothetical protein